MKPAKGAKSAKPAKRVGSAQSAEPASRIRAGGRAARPAPTALLERERRTLPDDERLEPSADETPIPTGEWPDAYASEASAPTSDDEAEPGDITPEPPEVEPDPVGELADRTRSRWEADLAPDDAEASDKGVADAPETAPELDVDDETPDRED